ncbi:MAG: hypothetical protein DRP56_02800 [Planctomycetota bacterium]|nr:MAG: hypothetical protein DRP56_02800 [Planctomycetota bacterium]
MVAIKKSQAPVPLQDLLIAENRRLRAMNRNLVKTARDLMFENSILKMKVGGLYLLLPAPDDQGNRREKKIKEEISYLEDSLKLERSIAGFSGAEDGGRTARVVEALTRDIAILKNELETVRNKK